MELLLTTTIAVKPWVTELAGLQDERKWRFELSMSTLAVEQIANTNVKTKDIHFSQGAGPGLLYDSSHHLGVIVTVDTTVFEFCTD